MENTTVPPIPSISKTMTRVSGLIDFQKQISDSFKSWADATKALQAATEASDLDNIISGLGKFSALMGGLGAVAGLVKIFLPNPVVELIKTEMKIISKKLDELAQEIQDDTQEIINESKILHDDSKIWGAAEDLKDALNKWGKLTTAIQNYYAGKGTLDKVADFWTQLGGGLIANNTMGQRAEKIADGWAKPSDDGDLPYSKLLVDHFNGNVPAVLNLMQYYFRLITAARAAACGHWVIFKALEKNPNPSLADWEAALKKFKQWEGGQNPNARTGVAAVDGAMKYVTDNFIENFLDDFTPYLQTLLQGIKDLTDPTYLATMATDNLDSYLKENLIPTVTDGANAGPILNEGLKKTYPFWYWTVLTFQTVSTPDSYTNSGPAFSYFLNGSGYPHLSFTSGHAEEADFQYFVFRSDKLPGGYNPASSLDYPLIAIQMPLPGKPSFVAKDGLVENLHDWVSERENSGAAFLMAYHMYGNNDEIVGHIKNFWYMVDPMGTALSTADGSGAKYGWSPVRVHYGHVRNSSGRYEDVTTLCCIFLFNPIPVNS